MTVPVRFSPAMLERPSPRGLDVVTTLQHFAIVTYTVALEDLARHLHPRFTPDVVATEHGDRALVSVVPFLDLDFRFVRCPRPRFSFGQTNYRAYVLDRETGERCVWFFGTCLGSRLVAVPRHVWRLPWHRGRFRFDCEWSETERRYSRYRLTTDGAWAPARLDLCDGGDRPTSLGGFPDLESGLVVLTHPLAGYYRRRDGRLGSYRVWHDRIDATTATVVDARFPLLDRLGLVPEGRQREVHSALVQRAIEFTIYLPPRAVDGDPAGRAGNRSSNA